VVAEGTTPRALAAFLKSSIGQGAVLPDPDWMTGPGAFSGKVDTGFPQKMRPTKEAERVLDSINRNALWN
jgi:hypothetical protein